VGGVLRTDLDSSSVDSLERPAPPTRGTTATRRSWRRLGVAGLIAFAILTAWSQFYVRHVSADVQRQILEDPQDLSQAWERYRDGRVLSPFGLGMGEARDELRSAALEQTDRVFSSYRQESPSTLQGDWRRAANHLQMALDLGADEAAVEARLLIAKAHVGRIEAASLKSQGKVDEANRRWNDALFSFRRASELDRSSPDPILGLARIHAYDRFNLEKLSEALEELTRRGYTWKAREKAQLADGNLFEGRHLFAMAQQIEDRQRRRELLDRSALHLHRAVRGYEEILDFGLARQNRDRASDYLRAIERSYRS
jgi:hypothetical protein